MSSQRPSLSQFTEWLNNQSRRTIVEDGVHAAMFFLVGADGRVAAEAFDADETRPVMERRSRELGDAVARTGAVLAAIVSEAWSAPAATVPVGHGVDDSPEARDVLIVAAMDGAHYVAFETPVNRAADGAVTLGESVRRGAGGEAGLFRGAWEHWRAAKPTEA